MVSPVLGMALVIGVLGVMLSGLRLYQKAGAPHPELVRKLMHVGTGFVCIAFPWVFDRSWPVLVLGCLTIVGMLALRLVSGLRGGVGQVVGSVQRSSLGEVYFPLAVAILFYLYLNEDSVPAEDRLWLYCIPILILTLADAAAALIGVYYGSWHYSTSDGRKSTEGSFAFFVCAFFCVHVPLLLGTNLGRPQTLLIAVLLAFVAMLFEAIAWAGLDNLALPLVGYLLLRVYLGLSVEELAVRLAVTAGLLVFVMVYRKRTTLYGNALVGACLVGYLSWALGDWRWLLVPLILFVAYKVLAPRVPPEIETHHNIHAVICVCAAGLIWLFLYSLLKRPEFYYLFTLAFAAQMAMIALVQFGWAYPQLSGPVLLAVSVLKGWLLLFVPFLVIEWHSPACLRHALWAVPAIALAAVGFYLTQPQVRNCATNTPRWLRQAVNGGLGSAVGLLPLYVF